MSSHVLSGLLEKRAELAGELQTLRSKLNDLEAMLVHVDRTILIFDPDCELERIRPKKKMPASQWFERGEASQLALSGLHEHHGDWVSTPTIVNLALTKKKLTHLVGRNRDRFSTALVMALSRYHRRGIVERSQQRGSRGEYSWRLSPTIFDAAQTFIHD